MKKSFWDKYSNVYNLFMMCNRKMYESVYCLIRSRIKDKNVLELATGTGLVAKNVAESARRMTASDYSEKMINKAKKGKLPVNLSFSVQNAENLSYSDNSYDVVIISNALHIMSSPEKVLDEIKRVIKPDGTMIAPTFVHGKMNIAQEIYAKILKFFGFNAVKWSNDEFLNFLKSNGWSIRMSRKFNGWFPLVYVECSLK